MALINNSFNGKMNLDTQLFRVQNGDYIDGLNITRDSPGEGNDIVVTNVVGNTKVSYSLPPGSTNKVIGKFPDRIRNRVYIYVWCSNNQDLILYYDRDNDTIVELIKNITDTSGVDVLNFNPSKRINHIDIIYNDTNGDMVFWTDGNTTPKKMNVSHIENGDYSSIKRAFIEAAKAPFLDPPTCAYGSDTTRNSNSLRRTLFQFCSRPQYDDFEKGCFFSYSKVPLPVGFYGSDNDIDNTKNNFITVTVETGDENVIAIEIGMRYNIGNNWSDVVLAASLNKEQLGIPDNSTYQFLFYNDQIYPTIQDGVQYVDGVQVIPLFYWFPQLADCQAMANGNVPVYAAITEGYDNFPVDDIDVTITAANQTNSPPDTDPPALTYVIQSTNYVFTVSGSVPTGTFYQVIAFVNFPTPGVITLASYTSIGGDTTTSVAAALFASMSATYQQSQISSTFTANFPGGGSILQINVTSGGGGGGGISTEKTWMNDCPYSLGLVYFDEQGRDMPGVVTFSNPVDTNNDFLLTTPSFSESSGTRQTPVISASINHLPPTGAVKYCWVRKRLQYVNPVEYETCDFQDPGDGFYYLCLANVEEYKEENSQFIYGTILPENLSECRIKIIAAISSSSYSDNNWGEDYQILGTVTKTLTGGASPNDDRVFIKIKEPASPPATPYTVNMLVMVYTPLLNPTSDATSVYREWGETYDITGGYHMGMDQDQTASLPATFTWEEGDVYYHDRTMYKQLLANPASNADTVPIMDENFSDFFNSAVNDNGRAQVIEVNARQVYNPVLIRFGGAYQSGTTINNVPDFYFENQQEADRGFGDIRKLYIRDRYLRVYQKFKIGVIPILLQIVRDTAGNPLEANSDILLNKINYPYIGNYGIGDVPESFAANNYADYFVDDYRGVACRLSQDGITVLSVLYECNSFFVQKLPYYRKSLNNGYGAALGTYTGDPSVNGVFDAFTNKYIVALEEINRYNSQGYLTYHQDAYTLCFNEVRTPMEGFESFLSYKPEAMVCIDTLLITFKDGETWKHGFGSHCNFYGTQYNASITAVFNDNGLEKKSWMALTQLTDTVWECPLIYTNVNTYSNQRQETSLVAQNFTVLEGNPSSAIKRDSHSPGGIINGNFMKGNYIVIKFLKQNASSLVYLNGVSVLYRDSPLTAK